MPNKAEDDAFATGFFESVLRHDPKCEGAVEILGGLYTKQGRIADGLKMDRKLIRLRPKDATAHYNLACSLALSGRKTDAIRALRKAVELGYRDFKWMVDDPDLESLRDNPRFAAIVAELRHLA
jgi:Flp pilus assembly protein TadD